MLATGPGAEARPARETRDVPSDAAAAGTGSAALASLPAEAQTTWRLAQVGGPFPYAKDGVVFSNRERLLPSHPRGYYHEYTVRTPGSRDRGARRIVCGGYAEPPSNGRPPAHPEVCYYTADHYASFARIVH